ncbi:MAG: selenocysteine lyase SclA [Lachnospiraceae bacterium]|nr:selenocysteine lyase SclA [Lachnospiraceae bacterium]
MEKEIYLNYAGTSICKPKPMIDALCHYLQKNQWPNHNRSFVPDANAHFIFAGREQVGSFFHVRDASNVVFTANITTSLNMILHGLLQPGSHVVVSRLEHNAVMRPLHLLQEKRGIQVTTLACDWQGRLCGKDLEEILETKPNMLLMTHASNVLGTIQPIREVFQKAREYGVITVLDTAQTAGYLPIHMEADFIDVLAFTGHKGLQALSGIGGFVLRPEIAEIMEPWLTGGTGNFSHDLTQPAVMPEKFESGTLNAVGIFSLSESIKYIEEIGLEQIRVKESALTRRFLDGIGDLPVSVLGCLDERERVPLVSLISEKIPAGDLSFRLYNEYGIMTRSGLHCAPAAHQVAGTFPGGAVRFSFGYDTTEEEIGIAVRALRELTT